MPIRAPSSDCTFISSFRCGKCHLLVLDPNKLYSSCITFALMAAALGPMIILTNDTPDRIPADLIAEEQEDVIEGKTIVDGKITSGV